MRELGLDMQMNRFVKKLCGELRRFRDNESGAVAMIYGPMAIMLLIAAGVAIDYSRAYLVKKEIGRALDAAVLAAGSMAVTDQDAMRDMAERYFDANISEKTKLHYNPQITVAFGDEEVTVTSEAVVPTILMKLAGHESVSVDARSVAGRTLVNIEVALVLDNTGSMSGSKMSDLKSAAKTLVDTLYDPQGSENFVQFALVPFTGGVNVGTDKINASWIDKDGVSTAAQEDFKNSYFYWLNPFYLGMTGVEALGHFNADWQGCVRARVGTGSDGEGGTVDLDLWDVPPNGSDPNTLWAPMIKPVYGYTTWWGGQPSNSSIRNRLEYDDTCPNAEILPLTNVASTIKSRIDGMNASGWTSIPIGLIWGWRVLSSDAPYTEGATYDTENMRKVIVLLTDGENNHQYYDPDPRDGVYSAYGMPAYGHLGTGWLGNKLDDKLEDICENVKSKNILIYSITFQVNDAGTRNLMRDCATREDMYFNSPSGASLQDAFDEIASGLQKLRLRQ